MSVGSTQPFRPAGTVAIAAGTTPVYTVMPSRGEAVLITNASTGMAFVRYGTDGSVVASITDTPIPAGARMLMHAGNIASTVSVVLGSGSGTVYVSRGDGTVY